MADLQGAENAKKAGNKAYASKDYSAALAHFSEAISLNDSDYIYYSNRSACRAQLKDVCAPSLYPTVAYHAGRSPVRATVLLSERCQIALSCFPPFLLPTNTTDSV